MDLIFAPALPSQHDEITQLLLAAFTPYVVKLGRGPESGPYPWLAAAIDRGDVHVALDGPEIVGLVTATRRGDELVIDQLGVAPDRQGNGIGSWLLRQTEHAARNAGVKALTLQTAEIMPDLLRLYARHGFEETRRALPDHGDDEYLRVHMTKPL